MNDTRDRNADISIRGGQKAEFVLRGDGLRMFFADAKSKTFLCKQRRSGGRFFLNFPCTFKTHDCFNFFAKFHGGFALLTQHLAFLWSKVWICISCCSMYTKSNTILDIQTEAPKPTRLDALQSFCNTVPILDMWFCNLFNVSVRQSVGYIWTKPLHPFVVNLQRWALDWTWIGLDPVYDELYWFWIGSGL